MGYGVGAARTRSETEGPRRWTAWLWATTSAGLVVAGCARDVAPVSSRTAPPQSAKRLPPSQSYSQRVVNEGERVPRGGGVYKLGIPYQIKGQWFRPAEQPGYDQAGIASWYGTDFHGRKTANGEVFDMNALTAAHPTLPMPSHVLVTNLENGRTILVRVNDRGPYAQHRVIDLSRQSARQLGFALRGTARVRVKYMGPAPLNGDETRERRFLAQQPWRSREIADASPLPPAYVAPSTTQARPPVATRPWRPTAAVATIAAEPAPWRPAAAAPSGATGSGGRATVIQAGIFRSQANAERLRDQLAGAGPARAEPIMFGGAKAWRVTVGPLPPGAGPNRALQQSVGAGATGARIASQ